METKHICAQCGAVVLSGPAGKNHGCPSTTVIVTPESSSPLQVGSVHGDYEILEEVGRGGMGIVYKARQVSLNRLVAYKTILAGHLSTEAELQRFCHEAQTAAGLEHPNIVTVLETGKYKGQPYLSMPFVRGIPLSKMKVPFLNHEAARLLVTVARAVHFAHEHGIVHRDLKPGNILIDVNGIPHITDFGLAKRLDRDVSFTQTGMIAGTPGYIAPEEASGAQTTLSAASDIFSLGAVLYFMLTGSSPFACNSPLESLCWTMERDPIAPTDLSPQTDPDLESICLKCLEKDVLARYHSAAELADDLERWLRGEPLRSRPANRFQALCHWSRHNLWAMRSLLIIAALTAVAVIYAQYSHIRYEDYLNQFAFTAPVPPHWLDPPKLGVSSPLWSFLLGLAPLAFFQRQKRLGSRPGRWPYAVPAAAVLLGAIYLMAKFIDATVWHRPDVWYGRALVFLPTFNFLFFGIILLREVFREHRLAQLHVHLPAFSALTQSVQRRQNVVLGFFLIGCLVLLLLTTWLLPESRQPWASYAPLCFFIGLWSVWLLLGSRKTRGRRPWPS